MPTREWIVNCPEPHSVRIEHSYWSGRATISVDGTEIYRRGFALVDWGFTHRFSIDGIEIFAVATCHLLAIYTYDLRVGVLKAAPRWQFSLRTLLLATTLAAVVLGLVVALRQRSG